MTLFTRNVPLKPYLKTSPWRKIAIGTWRNCGDPSVYTFVEVDTGPLTKTIEDFKMQGIRLTPTTIVAKGVALSLKQHPQLNSLLRFGRQYLRQNVDIFLQVDPEGEEDNLTGVIIREFDKKSLKELSSELSTKSQIIKKEKKEDFHEVKKMLNYFPGLLMRPLLALMSFLNYDLNIWTPYLASPRDSFGSAMVTSVGMMGIENALVPLIPHSRCPLLVCVGKITERAVVKDGNLCIRPMMTLGVTFDHRYMDGALGHKMLKVLKTYLNAPY